jgi:hypothetical protein
MVSIIRGLLDDTVVSKVTTTKSGDWLETTLTDRHGTVEGEHGNTARLISWSGKYDS